MSENILDTIIRHKTEEIKKAKVAVSMGELERSKFYNRKTLSLKQFLQDATRTGIIAEFKRKSPSKGIFNSDAKPELVTRAYAEGGASGLSILTDEFFFAGNKEDLVKARFNVIPILRKDFIIDEYQIAEAKAIGADVILLIAACLTPVRVLELASYAKSLGLEVLLEIHNEDELIHICEHVDLVGVNNRDLKTFTVDVNRSIELVKKIPEGKIKISESGISDVKTIMLLKQHGYSGFLIGETFMKEKDPAIAFARFVHTLKNG
ncbi:MAG: indole-3-glycerol phosphate synthase TrpC [Chitinophagaceae bacterium]